MHTHIQLKTEVPGPKSRELLARRNAAVAAGIANMTPIFAADAHGSLVTDVDGNVFIDFAGGIGVLNIGHTHEEVNDAVRIQVDKFLHTCFHVAMYEGYVRLAEELIRLTPGRGDKKAFLANTGAEAVENAIKLARRFTGRPAVIAFENAFHGRTLLGMSLTAKVDNYKRGFGPFAPEVYRAPFPDLYRSPFPTDEETVDWAFKQFVHLVEHQLSPDHVAAVILEPVQGEGGFLVTPPEFLSRIVDYCRSRDILFIADEIQTGFARTGRWFAMDHYGLEADLYTMAKSMGAGMPISAVVGRSEVMDAAQVGGLGGTYGGNPVACAAALKTLEIMERDDFNARAEESGRQIFTALEQMKEEIPLIGDVRGLGAMVAVELVKDRETKEPAAEEAAAVRKAAYENGLLLLQAGTYNNVIRFLAPVNISPGQLLEGLGVLRKVLEEVSSSGAEH